jgi:hypothetical protein
MDVKIYGKRRRNMEFKKLKEPLFVFLTYIFLFIFFLSFISMDWSNETLNSLKGYIGALGIVVVIGYIERSQKVLSKESYIWIKIFALIFSILLHMYLLN